MENPEEQPKINLMTGEQIEKFLNSGFLPSEIETFNTAHTINGIPKVIDFDSDAVIRMLQDRFEILNDFYSLGYTHTDYEEYILGLYATKALKSPFDLLSAESAPKRSDLTVGEYNRRIARRNSVRGRVPSYFGQQEVMLD